MSRAWNRRAEYGERTATGVCRVLLGVEHTVIRNVELVGATPSLIRNTLDHGYHSPDALIAHSDAHPRRP
ncbi:MAG: hypothetical protein ACREX3_16285 [Gammaproteobacteria bacterium]